MPINVNTEEGWRSCKHKHWRQGGGCWGMWLLSINVGGRTEVMSIKTLEIRGRGVVVVVHVGVGGCALLRRCQ